MTASAVSGPDKVNQIRHVRFFGDSGGVTAHMAKHREILAPTFEAVTTALWSDPGSRHRRAAPVLITSRLVLAWAGDAIEEVVGVVVGR